MTGNSVIIILLQPILPGNLANKHQPGEMKLERDGDEEAVRLASVWR